jgi:hypothetical protein
MMNVLRFSRLGVVQVMVLGLFLPCRMMSSFLVFKRNLLPALGWEEEMCQLCRKVVRILAN